MRDEYPALNEDIFFGKIQTSTGLKVRIRNTTTEKDFKANTATAALLSLCTGTYTVDEIVERLSRQFGEPPEELAGSVAELLIRLQEKGVITLNTIPSEGPSRAKVVKVRNPIESAQIEITNTCNLSCVHCVNDSGNPYPDELTTEEIFSLIDTLSSLGVHNLTLSGGEPLLHPDFFKIVEYARKAPMTVNIFTNGTLITEKHIEKCKELGVSRFAVSIDSMDENIHDTLRGQKGALRKTLHAVKLLKEAGFSIRPSLSLTQLNKDSIIDIFKYFKEQHFTDYQIFPVAFSGRGIEGVAITPEEYYHALVEQFQYLKEEFREGIQELHQKTGKGCGISTDRIGIKADGTILACPGCTREMDVGNIRNTDLAEFWDQNRKLETIRTMRVEEDRKCFGCRYVSFCDGCIATAFILEREFQCYSPYSCAFYRAYDDVLGLTD